MRTLDEFKNFVILQKNHWQLMCDISNNDYDIHYFDGRVIIDEEYRCNCESGEYDTDKLFCKIINDINSLVKEQYEFYEKHHYYEEKKTGYIDELELLRKYILQDYDNP